MKEIPTTVKAVGTYQLANDIRGALKQAAALTNDLRKQCMTLLPEQVGDEQARAIEGRNEAIANATLAYRHLEDASMRLGKVLQALDGGASVYDRATTVGA